MTDRDRADARAWADTSKLDRALRHVPPGKASPRWTISPEKRREIAEWLGAVLGCAALFVLLGLGLFIAFAFDPTGGLLP